MSGDITTTIFHTRVSEDRAADSRDRDTFALGTVRLSSIIVGVGLESGRVDWTRHATVHVARSNSCAYVALICTDD